MPKRIVVKKIPFKTKRFVFFKAFKKTVVEFTQATSIHGLKYTTDSDTHLFWRIFWTILVFIFFCCANQLVATFYGDFIDNPTRVNIDTVNAKLPNLRFPAVTICSTEVLSYIVAKEFVNSLKLPKNVTNMTALSTIYQAIGMAIKVNYDENLLPDLNDLMEMNRYTIPELMSNLRQDCEKLFVKCRWRNAIVPCHKLFSPARTFFGQCCSFNIKQEGIRYKEVRAIEPGIMGGLSILLSPIVDDDAVTEYDARGFNLIIHNSDVFPTTINDPKLIGLGLETFIGIRPQEILCSNQVKQLSVSDRGCVFRDEKPLEFFREYDYNNCQTECMINNVVQNCGCSPYFFGTAGQHQMCNFTKIPCLVENYDLNFPASESPFFKCSCLPNCINVNYQMSINQVPLEKMPHSIEPFYEDLTDKSNHTVIHVYMGSQIYTRFRRDLIYNIINLIANFGSAYSLFLGVSTMSIIQLFYYFTFVLRRNYVDTFEMHTKIKKFLKGVEKPNLNKVKYGSDGSVIEIKAVDENQFNADKSDVDQLHAEDLIENQENLKEELKTVTGNDLFMNDMSFAKSHFIEQQDDDDEDDEQNEIDYYDTGIEFHL